MHTPLALTDRVKFTEKQDEIMHYLSEHEVVEQASLRFLSKKTDCSALFPVVVVDVNEQNYADSWFHLLLLIRHKLVAGEERKLALFVVSDFVPKFPASTFDETNISKSLVTDFTLLKTFLDTHFHLDLRKVNSQIIEQINYMLKMLSIKATALTLSKDADTFSPFYILF